MTSMKTKSYEELSKIDDFEKRYEYLKLNGKVAEETFGHARYLNQEFVTKLLFEMMDAILVLKDGLLAVAYLYITSIQSQRNRLLLETDPYTILTILFAVQKGHMMQSTTAVQIF